MLKNSSILFLLLCSLSTASLAQEYRFFGYHLQAPPALESEISQEDFAKLHDYQDHRTPEQCTEASAQSSFTIENTFGPQTGILTKSELAQARVVALMVGTEASIAVYYFKSFFKRPRPFVIDSTLQPCIKMPHDYSYPSGHAAAGYAIALALSRMFPEKKEIILRQGLQIGLNRAIGGVHHPSDLDAGRILAIQVVNRMLGNR